jgi:addiction module HigA family antidote
MRTTWKSSITTEETAMSNKLRPIHPGEILREEYLAPLGLSAHALAQALRVPATRIGEIVNERRAITPDTALRLARYFQTSPDFWMNLQTAYDLKVASADLAERVAREVDPRAA